MKKRMEVDTFNNTEKMRTTEVTNHKLWPRSFLWNTHWESNSSVVIPFGLRSRRFPCRDHVPISHENLGAFHLQRLLTHKPNTTACSSCIQRLHVKLEVRSHQSRSLKTILLHSWLKPPSIGQGPFTKSPPPLWRRLYPLDQDFFYLKTHTHKKQKSSERTCKLTYHYRLNTFPLKTKPQICIYF